jgi:phage repressor protein C with HTH and peptisase S24 domain
MKTPAERLKWARSKRYSSTSEAARSTGMHRQNLSDHEAGRRKISSEQARTYAWRFGVSPEWLLFGKGSPDVESENDASMTIPLAGTVNGGAAFVFIDQSETYPAPELIRFPSSREHIAFRVAGDSMSPRFMPGERLVFGPKENPHELINQEVMAQIDGGPLVVKVLRRGQTVGKWSLFSHNPAHEPIEDVTLAWVRPLEGWMK